jgi:hypothetical protein
MSESFKPKYQPSAEEQRQIDIKEREKSKTQSQGGKSQHRRRRPVTTTKKNRSRKYHKLAKFLKTHDYTRRRRRFR